VGVACARCGGWLAASRTCHEAGVALIFFLHGVLLSFGAMRAGALNWRLHALVQSCTFLFFPVLGIALYARSPQRVAGAENWGWFFSVPCRPPSRRQWR